MKVESDSAALAQVADKDRSEYSSGLLTRGVVRVPQDPFAPLADPLYPLQIGKVP
jgi:hypothetical protein